MIDVEAAGGTLALMLDVDGRVCQIAVDEVGLIRTDDTVPWRALLDDGDKAGNFIAAIERDGHALAWEMALKTEQAPQLATFYGVMTAGGPILFATTGEADLYDVSDALAEAKTDHASQLRAAFRHVLRHHRKQRHTTRPDLFEAMTKLTNDFAALQREMAKKNAELDRLNTHKDDLLGAVAHDLRTPLGTITGYADLIQRH